VIDLLYPAKHQHASRCHHIIHMSNC